MFQRQFLSLLDHAAHRNTDNREPLIAIQPARKYGLRNKVGEYREGGMDGHAANNGASLRVKRYKVFFWRMEDAEGRSDDFLAMDVLTTFLLSRTSQGEEPLDTGGGRVSLPRCLFWSSGHC